MKFDINAYKGKYVMHCKTEEEAKDFLKVLDSLGLKWCDGMSYLKQNMWKCYKEDTCYYFARGRWSCLEYFKESNYTILEWSDFMSGKFTKSDLRNGDVILRRKGDVEIVCLETGTFIRQTSGWNNLSDINEDLTSKLGCYCSMPDYDIIAVRRPTKPGDCRFSAFDEKAGELIYDRGKEMTLEEVCKALGREIKIVKEK